MFRKESDPRFGKKRNDERMKEYSNYAYIPHKRTPGHRRDAKFAARSIVLHTRTAVALSWIIPEIYEYVGFIFWDLD